MTHPKCTGLKKPNQSPIMSFYCVFKIRDEENRVKAEIVERRERLNLNKLTSIVGGARDRAYLDFVHASPCRKKGNNKSLHFMMILTTMSKTRQGK